MRKLIKLFCGLPISFKIELSIISISIFLLMIFGTGYLKNTHNKTHQVIIENTTAQSKAYNLNKLMLNFLLSDEKIFSEALLNKKYCNDVRLLIKYKNEFLKSDYVNVNLVDSLINSKNLLFDEYRKNIDNDTTDTDKLISLNKILLENNKINILIKEEMYKYIYRIDIENRVNNDMVSRKIDRNIINFILISVSILLLSISLLTTLIINLVRVFKSESRKDSFISMLINKIISDN